MCLFDKADKKTEKTNGKTYCVRKLTKECPRQTYDALQFENSHKLWRHIHKRVNAAAADSPEWTVKSAKRKRFSMCTITVLHFEQSLRLKVCYVLVLNKILSGIRFLPKHPEKNENGANEE